MINFNNTEIAFKYKSDKDLLRAKLLFKTIGNPSIVKVGKWLTNTALKIHFPIGWAIKPTLYKHFVGGETLIECDPVVNQLNAYHVKSILDFSVEGSNELKAMQHTLEETLRSVINASKNANIPFAVFKPTAFANEETLTAASENRINNPELKQKVDYFIHAIEVLCKTAFDHNIPIMIDAEDSWYQNFIDQVIEQMMQKFNTSTAIVYNTFQMYRTDRLPYLQELYKKSVENNFLIGAKFVRGAYMEKERKRALDMGYPSPIQPDKQATDDNYNAGLKFSVEHIDKIHIFSGSHNEYSNQYLTELLDQNNLSKNDYRVWFSQLYGMSDNISFNLAANGYNVAKYIPYGPVRNIVPYLIRRAEENTSIAGQTGRELNLLKTEIFNRKK